MPDIFTPAVETSGLRKAFGDVVAVDNLDLEVEAGSLFGFLGPNGAGKSTTIKILTGMLHPSSGKARILGFEGLLVLSVVQGLPHPTTVVTGLLVLSSTSVLLSLLGNFTSVAVPESRPVSSLSSAASPTGTLVMLGCLLVGATLGGAVVFGAALFRAPALQPVFALAIFAAVVIAYRLTLRPAARTLCERRDDVFHALGVG